MKQLIKYLGVLTLLIAPVAQIIAAAPTITSVTSATSDGDYKEGDQIAITLNFSERVTLTGGNLIVTLETGSTDRSVILYGTLAASQFTTLYTVQDGDTSSDLTVSTITLTGGTLRNDGGEDLVSFTPAANLAASSTLVIDTTPATVTNVTSSTTNATKILGDTVSIQVVFNEVMTVGGTPQLTLETGGVDRDVNYVSGTGSNTLTFTYTVQAGDTSSDLDYKATTSLALNGGTINDPAGNAATLTLAAPGASGSLGNNKAFTIDGTAPTVTNVTSTKNNGTYKSSDSMAITVVFSDTVTVTGTPQLTLETGASDRAVDYSSGSGSNTLTFTYTVQAGDTSGDLDYTGTTSLALNSGTIKDASGNAATLTLATPGAANSLANNKALVIGGNAGTGSRLVVKTAGPDISIATDGKLGGPAELQKSDDLKNWRRLGDVPEDANEVLVTPRDSGNVFFRLKRIDE